ncbi:MAG: JmjC domain-containing protein, partial [Rhodoferax sp.]
MPLKILANFEPEMEFVLEPGDMLYLPPRCAHDGVAEGECMTYSIGFRSPNKGELARELLQRFAEDAMDLAGDGIYKDPGQAAVGNSGEVPLALVDFARASLEAVLKDPVALQRALGEYLSEPKANVWFEASVDTVDGGVQLDRRTRLLYDKHHVFINGEAYRAGGKDAALIHRLADRRSLSGQEVKALSPDARGLLGDWAEAGWLYNNV